VILNIVLNGEIVNNIQKTYNILSDRFGKQNWWPTTTENRQFEIIIGAILTQNTAWKNAEKAIANLKKANLVDAKKILKTKKEKLAQLIRPAGYYSQKAERLKIIAKFYLENKNPAREQLLNVKGVGPETADSILLYAYSRPFFVVDAYTKRIFSRLGLIKTRDYHEVQDFFHANLEKDEKMFNEFHALIVELAKRHCNKKPVCEGCPLKITCKHLNK
jgi:endonuclease-3 related protein